MPIERYMEYMKSAVEEIRKADPDAKIQGICSTADKTVDPNVDTMTALLKCIKLGADDYMDYITMHPYALLDNSHPITQQEARRDHFAYLKKHNVKAGLWNGENFFIFPTWMPTTNYSARWEPENLARHFLVDMGEGLAGSTPTYYRGSLMISQLHPFTNVEGYKTRHVRVYPNVRFAAHSACAYFVAGAEPLHTLELKCDAMGYVFKNGNRLLSSVWNSISKQETKIKFSVPDGAVLTVYDVMGNVLKKYTGEVTLPLSPRPYYMQWDGATPQAVLESFNNSVVSGENPVAVAGATILKRENSSCLMLNIKNTSGVMIKEAAINISSNAFQSPVEAFVKSLQDAQSQELNIPVVLTNVNSAQAKITVTPELDDKKAITTSAAIKNAVEITPVSQKFKIEKCVDGNIDDAEDLSAEFTITASGDRMMTIFLSVKDNKRGLATDKEYNQDCIELFIDTNPFGGGKGSHRQILIPIKSGKFRKVDIAGNIELTEDGYKARIYLCVRKAKYLGFDIAIDDSDADARKSQIVWKGTKYNYKNREDLAVLEITRDVAPKE